MHISVSPTPAARNQLTLQDRDTRLVCHTKEERRMLHTIWQQKHTWLGHVFRDHHHHHGIYSAPITNRT